MNIDTSTSIRFTQLFNADMGKDYCYGKKLVYTDNKSDKSYYIKNLTAKEIESLMKKSIQDKHNYLFDAVKDNPCPPYRKDVLY